MKASDVLRLLDDDRVTRLDVEVDGEQVTRLSVVRAPTQPAQVDAPPIEVPERPESIWQDPDMWSASGVAPL